MPPPIHLTEGDYAKIFPAGIDEFPTVTNEEHYIDAWMLNSVFQSIQTMEQYILDYLTGANQPPGYDIVGEDGQFLIPIPPGLYGSYLAALAWDSQLLAENIKAGVNIFGVAGSLSQGNKLSLDICTGGTPSDNAHYGGNDATKAFDNILNNYYENYPFASPAIITYDLGAGNERAAVAYSIQASGYGIPTAWTFQGSNNNTDWTTLDTRTTQTFTAQQTRFFSNFTNGTAYRYYRWNITACNTTDLCIAEIEAFAIMTA